MLTILILGVMVVACGGRNDADALFVDYQQRISNGLEIAPPSPGKPPNIAAFPSRDERLFVIPDIRQGMLDVYALRECGILSLVAKRNNQLGKVAAPSQHWLYELALWRKLRQCWNTPAVERLDADDRERLHQLTSLKTRRLPQASWNALFDSSEWIDNFSRASAALAPKPSLSLSEFLAALDYLRYGALHQFDPRWTPDSGRLESHLYTLQSAPLSAQVLRGLLLARQRLDELSNAIEARLQRRPVCYKGHSNPGAEQLHGIFIKSFIGDVQPYLALLSRTSRQWLEAVNALLDAHQVSRTVVERYRWRWLSMDNPEAPWQRFQQAVERHVLLWQDIWRGCGLMPQAKNAPET